MGVEEINPKFLTFGMQNPPKSTSLHASIVYQFYISTIQVSA